MAGASQAELQEVMGGRGIKTFQNLFFQAFKLFDADGDGVITIDELKTLISKVGGDMSQAEAKALIQKADKNQNQGIDFSEFAKLWEALHGEEEVIIREISEKVIVVE